MPDARNRCNAGRRRSRDTGRETRPGQAEAGRSNGHPGSSALIHCGTAGPDGLGEGMSRIVMCDGTKWQEATSAPRMGCEPLAGVERRENPSGVNSGAVVFRLAVGYRRTREADDEMKQRQLSRAHFWMTLLVLAAGSSAARGQQAPAPTYPDHSKLMVY